MTRLIKTLFVNYPDPPYFFNDLYISILLDIVVFFNSYTSLYPPSITSNFIKHLYFSTYSEDIFIYYSKTKIISTPHNFLKSSIFILIVMFINNINHNL